MGRCDPSSARALESFQTSPGYQFQLEEAQKASDRAASAGGRYASGSQLRELQSIAQNTANMEFGRYTQGLQNIAGVGQSSAGQFASQASNLGQNLGATQMQSGQAQAQGFLQRGQVSAANSINQANIISGLVSQGAQAYGMSQGGGGSGGGAPPQNIPYGLPMGGPSNFLTSNPMMVA